MYVVDSSFWVAWIWESDSHHRQADRWLTEARNLGTPLFAPPTLLPEVAGAVARRSESSEIGRLTLQLLLDYRHLTITEMGRDTATLVAELAADIRLRGADAAFVAVAMLLAVPLITLDNEQLDKARHRVTAETPQETHLP